MVEHVDVVAELDRSSGLQDDAGGEVLGDAPEGEDGDDADEDGGRQDRLDLRPEEREANADADEQEEVERDPRRELALVLGDPVDAAEHRGGRRAGRRGRSATRRSAR